MRIEVLETPDVGTGLRDSLRALWADAFGDRFTDEDAEHAYGGVHVIAYDGKVIVGHASAVPRRIRFGREWRTVGYVEAVATRTDRQRTGVGTAVMGELHDLMSRRWPIGMLSTSRATSFYEKLGWVRWQGPSYVLTDDGLARTAEDAGLMVRFSGTGPAVDTTMAIVCEDRSGDAW